MMEPNREPLSHHGGAGEDGRDLCPKGAGDLRGPRSVEATNSDDARPSPVAIMVVFAARSAHRFPESDAGAALSTVNKAVTTVNQLVHIVDRGDAQRGTYRREGDGAHRRGADEAVTTRLLFCTFTTTRRDKEAYLPDPARGG